MACETNEIFPKHVGVYVLEDYEFAYNLEDLDKSCTWGNVMPKKGSQVYGLVSQLSEEQLAKLDKSEDVPIDYLRVALDVKKYANGSINHNKKLKVWVYVGADKNRFVAPKITSNYENIILKGANKEKLPKEYIDNYLKIPFHVKYSSLINKVSVCFFLASVGCLLLIEKENFYKPALTIGMAACGALLKYGAYKV